MANIRIIYDDASIRASSIVADSTAPPTSVDNVLTEYKGQAHRSVGRSVQYTLTWSSMQTVGGVVLPATNLSSEATIRVQLYSGVTPVGDSGTIWACPGTDLELWNWTVPLNANAFIFGGASKTAVWFNNQVTCDKVVISLVDTTANTAGYIDCSKIIVGGYWEPMYNVSNGINVTISDTSSSNRNEAGDLISNRSVIFDQISFDFSVLLEADKLMLSQILRKVGTSRNILVSVFPDSNSTLEQNHIIYGKRSNSTINTELYGIYRHSMDIEGW